MPATATPLRMRRATSGGDGGRPRGHRWARCRSLWAAWIFDAGDPPVAPTQRGGGADRWIGIGGMVRRCNGVADIDRIGIAGNRCVEADWHIRPRYPMFGGLLTPAQSHRCARWYNALCPTGYCRYKQEAHGNSGVHDRVFARDGRASSCLDLRVLTAPPTRDSV
jgi:hypothetical protein